MIFRTTMMRMPSPFFSTQLFSIPPPYAPLRAAAAHLPFPLAMASQNIPISQKHDHEDSTNPIDLRQYPKPLSPPYPEISKGIELKRAMSASSKSSLFTLTQSQIIFEDDWLVIVDKPAGVYCETLLSSYSSSHSLPELHLANRLDRDTSGLMIVTKSNKVAAKLVKAFTDHMVKKTYLALCAGRRGTAPLRSRNVRVVSGHGRSRHGAWRVYGLGDVGRVLPGGSVVKNMDTAFQILSVNGIGEFEEPKETIDDDEKLETIVAVIEGRAVDNGGEEKDEILVRAYPRSGRTHQIRLHCQYLGMSIIGDVKYGGVDRWRSIDCEFHNLHAESLSFEHPVTGVRLRFHSHLPPWVKVCLP